MDSEKQDAINLFLGYFLPQKDKPALWELDSDQHCKVGRNGRIYAEEDGRSAFKRSLSDGNILHENCSPMLSTNRRLEKHSNSVLSRQSRGSSKVLLESSPETSSSGSDIALSRYTPSMPQRRIFGTIQRERGFEGNHIFFSEGDATSCSNFVDLDWLSSSGNSCEEESFERSYASNSPTARESSENVITGESTPSVSEYGSSMKVTEQNAMEVSQVNTQKLNVVEEYSENFVQWVKYGETLCY